MLRDKHSDVHPLTPVCLQGKKLRRDYIILLENHPIVPGSLCLYRTTRMEDDKNHNEIVIAEAYVRRGSGGVRKAFLCLAEKGYIFFTEAFTLVRKCTMAEQERHGLLAAANGARFSFFMAKCTGMPRSAAKRKWVTYHRTNFLDHMRAMHPPELCAVTVCDIKGNMLNPDTVLEAGFENLAKWWAKGSSAGMTPIPRLDQNNQNILWGFYEKDNTRAGRQVEGLIPWPEDNEDGSEEEEGEGDNRRGAEEEEEDDEPGDEEEEEEDEDDESGEEEEEEEEDEEPPIRDSSRSSTAPPHRATGAGGKGLVKRLYPVCPMERNTPTCSPKVSRHTPYPTYTITLNLSEPEPCAAYS